MREYIDRDASNASMVVGSLYKTWRDAGLPRRNQEQRSYTLYHAILDMAQRNPDLPHISLAKIFSIVENKWAQEIKTLFASAPYIQHSSEVDALKPVVELQDKFLHTCLVRGGFLSEASLALKMKILYGVAYLETIPERAPMSVFVPINGQVHQIMHQQFSLRCRAFAPWDVLIDPHATSLNTPKGCRGLIKIRLVSMSEIRKRVESGAYGDIDIDKMMDSSPNGQDAFGNQLHGLSILRDLGLQNQEQDDDLGVLLGYESPDRYIDMLHNGFILQDRPNPYAHGMVNLTAVPHRIDPHTQNKIYGNGEAKINEVLQLMLGDWFSMIFQGAQMALQPTIFYRSESITPSDMIVGVGSRIPVATPSDKPVTHDYNVVGGNPTTIEQIQLIPILERAMDVNSTQTGIARSEGGQNLRTATEVETLASASDIVTEASIRIGGEAHFLSGLAVKAFSQLEQFTNREDYVAVFGPLEADKIFTINPYRLPLGVTMRFKATSEVMRQSIMQRTLATLTPLIQSMLAQGQFEYARIVLKRHDVEEDEIDMIINEGMMNRQQAMMLQVGMANQEANAQPEQKKVGK